MEKRVETLILASFDTTPSRSRFFVFLFVSTSPEACLQGLQTELKRNKSERLFAQAAGVHCVANGQAAGRLANIYPSLGRARRVASRSSRAGEKARSEAFVDFVSYFSSQSFVYGQRHDAKWNFTLRVSVCRGRGQV